MEWREAKERTREGWLSIRESVGQAETLELLSRVNSLTALCEKAGTEAGGEAGMCAYCAFYQQFGGCMDVSAQMSERIVSRDWDGLRDLIDRFLTVLDRLDCGPSEMTAGSGAEAKSG